MKQNKYLILLIITTIFFSGTREADFDNVPSENKSKDKLKLQDGILSFSSTDFLNENVSDT